MQRFSLYGVHKRDYQESVTIGQTDARTHTQTDARLSLYCVHKLISIDVHCDLDLWPLTSKINRVHPLITVNMFAKSDKEIHNG